MQALAAAQETERSVPVDSGDRADDHRRPFQTSSSGLMAPWDRAVTPSTCPTATHIAVDGQDSPVSS